MKLNSQLQEIGPDMERKITKLDIKKLSGIDYLF